jgi:hypothetical protein
MNHPVTGNLKKPIHPDDKFDTHEPTCPYCNKLSRQVAGVNYRYNYRCDDSACPGFGARWANNVNWRPRATPPAVSVTTPSQTKKKEIDYLAINRMFR